ncbi:4-oxalocrotonate tautomerase [Rhizoctonia solani]|uniref:4-oxalocrotonate tautomerase n=1 Tax=Rhizoctonia solani TaxID=456999 RepID=A0A8H7GZB4_9AGAM|nr:4-oxalocrotonate tautomerase [Rhizoctonia solani]
MPLHRIYTASGVYSAAEKQALATAITEIYAPFGLPAFYINVFFIDLPKDSYYIGGKPNDCFVRFNVQHIERGFPNKQAKLQYLEKYEQVLKPFTADKGLNWEVNIDPADSLVWHINGVSPPLLDSEAGKLWVKLNKAAPFEGPSFKDLD